MDSQELAYNVTGGKEKDVDYPLLKVIGASPVGQEFGLLFYGFGTIALFGIIASYHGMIYGSQPAGVRPGPGRLPAGRRWAGSTRRGGRRSPPCWRAA